MSFKQDIVLLITHSGDYFTIDRVIGSLLKRGVQTIRLDTDKFPMNIKINAYLNNDGNHHRVEFDDIVFDSQQVKSVWIRRIWEANFSPDLAPKFRAACINESSAVLAGFWDSLKQAFWLDKLAKIHAAENKLYQLRVAREVGLLIPKTLVTNDAQAARDFFGQVDEKMITKMLRPLSYGMEGSNFFMYTSVVKAADLEDAESLRYCPMVFQEQIPKLKELRAIYVDGKLFVGALDASIYADSTQDWRRNTPRDCTWKIYELPEEIIHRLREFMERLELKFGAFDFIVTPDGEHIFLEVNPNGEWGMLERDLDYPIADAIAETLVSNFSI
ncbi:MvdC family ATP-grasp ribosomal peptide maturase [Nostoc sp. UHCC 0870]|uniref:MvdC family ATP-grasp ribosomal peptide maturase n=1 Tax=Nostoc sp. UHCC 0870 TaxID=2914041 RepID=UPI001EDDBBB3|nr:MvdC family ATP-grasp ribosomal peptide maturase [Nostoc sp. UHCC 0870]UKP01146.1 MvdC family ATP-grasp ribosomal peptide maturase [Nostoc sp. UHCC 0870]